MDTGTIILILSFGLPVVAIIAVILWLKRDHKKLADWAKENKRRQAEAKPAKAKLLSASLGVQGGEIKKMVFISFEINDGYSAPYTASAGWFVESLNLHKMQEGNVIDVKVDKDDPKKIYPAETWAVYTEGYSSDFSVDKLSGNG